MKNNKIKITDSGWELLSQKIINQEKLVKDIQAEKAHAYTASGDGWHDNPGFNALEQKEFAACEELSRLLKIRETATIVKTEVRNSSEVQIGSIVKFEQFFFKDNTSRVSVWEIVGHLESDIKANKIAYDSPVALFLTGKKAGEDGEVALPMGKVKFKILALYNNWEEVKK